MLRNVFGESPDREESLPNVPTNARLAGAGNGHDTLVVGNHFGAATVRPRADRPAGLRERQLLHAGGRGVRRGGGGRPEPDATSARIGNTVGCVIGLRPHESLPVHERREAGRADPRRRRRARAVELLRRRRGPFPRRSPDPRSGSRTPAPTSPNGGLIGSDDRRLLERDVAQQRARPSRSRAARPASSSPATRASRSATSARPARCSPTCSRSRASATAPRAARTAASSRRRSASRRRPASPARARRARSSASSSSGATTTPTTAWTSPTRRATRCRRRPARRSSPPTARCRWPSPAACRRARS